jgi:hypothetical protein
MPSCKSPRARFSPTIAAITLVTLLSTFPGPSTLAQRVARYGNPHPAVHDTKGTPLVHTLSASVVDPELRTAITNAPKAAQWPDDNYASLIDTANVVVKADGTMVAEYRLAYKLFNERARDLAEINLPYNDGNQTLEVLRARTIRKGGTVMPVKPEDIRTQSPYSEYLMYDDSKSVGFSMPGIEDDCVVDYTWRVTSHPFIPGQFSERWTFSQPYPVSWSHFALTIPSNKPFAWKVYNNDKLKPTIMPSADGKSKTYVWDMKKINPIEEEPSMPELTDVHCWMEVTSLQNWQEMARWYAGLMKPQAVSDTAIRQTVQRLIEGKKTDEEKARALYDFAANKVRYVGLEFGISAFKPHAAKAVHEKLYGDCKDKATLLITMLQLAGIKAYPALLTAESQSAVRNQLPSLDAFNHCIAVANIGGKEIWLDATAEACDFGDIPSSDRGADAFVITDGVGQFKTIPPYTEVENEVSSRNHITLRPDRSGSMDIEVTMRGSTAQEWRGYARALTPEKRQMLVKQMVPPGGKLLTFSVPDGTEKSGPFVLKLKLEMPRVAKKTGSLLLLGMPNLIGAASRSPYTRESRLWPIVNRETFINRAETTFTLPEGYVVEEVPEAATISGPLFEYTYEVSRPADGKSVTARVTRINRSGRIAAADYAKVRGGFDRVAEVTDDQMIVLRKVN